MFDRLTEAGGVLGGLMLMGVVLGGLGMRYAQDHRLENVEAIDDERAVLVYGSKLRARETRWWVGALDRAREGITWELEVPGDMRPTDIDANDAATFVRMKNGDLIAISLASKDDAAAKEQRTSPARRGGKILWRWQAGRSTADAKLEAPPRAVRADAQHVYSWADPLTLVALDAETGDERWRWKSREAIASWHVDDEVITARDASGVLRILDPKTGENWDSIPNVSICKRGDKYWGIAPNGTINLMLPRTHYRTTSASFRLFAGEITDTIACGWRNQDFVMLLRVKKKDVALPVPMMIWYRVAQRKIVRELTLGDAAGEDLAMNLTDYEATTDIPLRVGMSRYLTLATRAPDQTFRVHVIDLDQGKITASSKPLERLEAIHIARTANYNVVHLDGDGEDTVFTLDGNEGEPVGALTHESLHFDASLVTGEGLWLLGPGQRGMVDALSWARADHASLEIEDAGSAYWRSHLHPDAAIAAQLNLAGGQENEPREEAPKSAGGE